MVRTACVTRLAPLAWVEVLPPLPPPLPMPTPDRPLPVDDEPLPVAGGSCLSSAPPTLLSLPVPPMLPIGTSLRVSVM